MARSTLCCSLALTLLTLSSPLEGQPCDLDFEDLAAGATFLTGDTFVTGGIPVTVEDFFFPGSTCTNSFSGGSAFLSASSCGIANDMSLNNVNLSFDFGTPIGALTLTYGYFGGNVNLEINGECANAPNPLSLPPIVGGVGVVAAGATCGTLTLDGFISSLKLGGQELSIDCLRLESVANCDLDFDGLTLGQTFSNGDTFTTAGVSISVKNFFFPGQTCSNSSSGGFASITATTCGIGQDVSLNNVNLSFDFGSPVANLSLIYGYSGGNINVTLNGTCLNAASPTALPLEVDGVGLIVSGTNCGTLTLIGFIHSFAIGGQELAIDCVRFEPTCPPPPSIRSTNLPSGVEDVPYDACLSASGGTLPLVWTITSPVFPPGLSLNRSTGCITGTPGAGSAGIYSFTTQACDACPLGSHCDEETFSLRVDCPRRPTVNATGLPSGMEGASYQACLVATGGFPPFQWTVIGGVLPPGIALNADSGCLAGIPEPGSANSYPVTVEVCDACATGPQCATADITVTVNANPAFIRGDANSDGRFDISDAVTTLHVLFGNAQNACLLALDADDDDAIGIADATYSIDALLGLGSPPPPPFSGCGIDPTPGPLSCGTFARCP